MPTNFASWWYRFLGFLISAMLLSCLVLGFLSDFDSLSQKKCGFGFSQENHYCWALKETRWGLQYGTKSSWKKLKTNILYSFYYIFFIIIIFFNHFQKRTEKKRFPGSKEKPLFFVLLNIENQFKLSSFNSVKDPF